MWIFSNVRVFCNNQNSYSSSQSSTPAPMTSQSMPTPVSYGNAGQASPVRSPVLTAKYAASAAPPSSPPMMPLSHSVPSQPMTPANDAFSGNYGYVPKAKTNVD